MSFSFSQQPPTAVRHVKDPLLNGVVTAGGDKNWFPRKASKTGDGSLVAVAHLRFKLSLFKIPDCNVALGTPTHHHSFVVGPVAQPCDRASVLVELHHSLVVLEVVKVRFCVVTTQSLPSQ